jgi:hypothetical protein
MVMGTVVAMRRVLADRARFAGSTDDFRWVHGFGDLTVSLARPASRTHHRKVGDVPKVPFETVNVPKGTFGTGQTRHSRRTAKGTFGTREA